MLAVWVVFLLEEINGLFAFPACCSSPRCPEKHAAVYIEDV